MSQTLEEAKAWLRDRVDDGAECPCCTQFAKVYRRKLTASMITTLGRMLQRQEGDEYVYLPDIPQHSRDFSHVAYWGLAEEARRERSDGGHAGWWRVTPAGLRFLNGQLSVPKYARVYDGRLLGWDPDGLVKVNDVAPEFRLDDLMAGV